MRYAIHYSEVGVEIQPPLSPEATTGVLAELVRVEEGFNHGAAVGSANVTRQDEEGTAIVVGQPNRFRGLNDAKKLAQFIGTTIDPCGIHEIYYHGYDNPHPH